MSESEPKTVRWGMMATGGIARTMTKDLLIPPSTRSVHNLTHTITAAASSSSLESAQSFINEVVTPRQSTPCTPYASYTDLVKDPNVDIVYVGTPHSHHYQNCMLALTNGKAVLCEKALCVNAAQARRLVEEARRRKLFFMEAVWTRYFPLSVAVREKITSGAIGEVLRVSADLSIGEFPESFEASHRMVNLDLAGGALLDLGVYALTWLFQTAYHTVPKDKQVRPVVKGAVMTPEPRTGADENTTILLEFPVSAPSGKRATHGIATTSMRIHFDHARDTESATPAVRIQGDEGEIQVFGPIYRPSRFRVVYRDRKRPVEVFGFEFPGGTHGMSWEGDEAARCWSEGKLESDGMPWDESIAVMEVMDEVRRVVGLRYPDVIETTEFPVDLKSRDTNVKREFINRD